MTPADIAAIRAGLDRLGERNPITACLRVRRGWIAKAGDAAYFLSEPTAVPLPMAFNFTLTLEPHNGQAA